MQITPKTLVAVFCFAALNLLACNSALAQAKHVGISVKSGETIDLGHVYWTSNCRSILKSTPVAEIMEGPPEITVSVKDAKVIPRTAGCTKEVNGGALSLTAKEITSRKEVSLVIRVKYSTKDGERQNTRFYDVALFP
jgi:hypothetical protein